jgi:hypothetical protein
MKGCMKLEITEHIVVQKKEYPISLEVFREIIGEQAWEELNKAPVTNITNHVLVVEYSYLISEVRLPTTLSYGSTDWRTLCEKQGITVMAPERAVVEVME